MTCEMLKRWGCDACDRKVDAPAEVRPQGWIEVVCWLPGPGSSGPVVTFCPDHGHEVRAGLSKVHGPQTRALFEGVGSPARVPRRPCNLPVQRPSGPGFCVHDEGHDGECA